VVRPVADEIGSGLHSRRVSRPLPISGGLVSAKDPKDSAAVVVIVAVAITGVVVPAPEIISIAMAPF
jgi:hypothetical protein